MLEFDPPLTPIALPAGEIHLWLAFYNDIDHARLANSYRLLLDENELRQERRFHFEDDRRRYLVTRAAARTLLARYTQVAPRQIEFATNRYGRPFLTNLEPAARGLSFNISHCHSLIVLAVAAGRELGVDVENIYRRKAPVELAPRYFARSEAEALAALAASQQQLRFYEYWTLKESYIKARGMGLSIPLDAFSFHFSREQAIEFAIESSLQDAPTRWSFWQLRLTSEHLAALCAERVSEVTRVVMRLVIPLVHEQLLVPVFHRTSVSPS